MRHLLPAGLQYLATQVHSATGRRPPSQPRSGILLCGAEQQRDGSDSAGGTASVGRHTRKPRPSCGLVEIHPRLDQGRSRAAGVHRFRSISWLGSSSGHPSLLHRLEVVGRRPLAPRAHRRGHLLGIPQTRVCAAVASWRLQRISVALRAGRHSSHYWRRGTPGRVGWWAGKPLTASLPCFRTVMVRDHDVAGQSDYPAPRVAG